MYKFGNRDIIIFSRKYDYLNKSFEPWNDSKGRKGAVLGHIYLFCQFVAAHH